MAVLPLIAYSMSGKGDFLTAAPVGDTDFFAWMWNHRSDKDYFWKGYNLLRDLAKGLDSVHKQHLVHGNLKPSNVIIFDEQKAGPVAKLSGFSLSVVVDPTGDYDNEVWDMDRNGGIVQTPCFRAPELAHMVAPAPIGKRKPSDTWSFGMVCYSLSSNGFEPYHELKTTEEVRIGSFIHGRSSSILLQSSSSETRGYSIRIDSFMSSRHAGRASQALPLLLPAGPQLTPLFRGHSGCARPNDS